jgi:putative ABC transport system substrate-binding protein
MGWARLALVLTGVLVLVLVTAPLAAETQPARVYRVGVIMIGGPYSLAVDGLREGLRELGLEEGKQLVLLVRDAKGDLKSVDEAARNLERDNVDLIYSLSTSVTLATQRATKRVPIVFYAGADPVAVGLVENFRKPGGRLTGLHSQLTVITAKRLELLKEMVQKLRRVVAFYSPDNPSAQEAMKVARDAARQLKLVLVERRFSSVNELRASLHSLRPGEVDGMLYVSDATVTSQTDAILEAARTKKLPAIFNETASVASGALASYGISYHAVGRLSAKQIQRVLQGANPGDLPVEQLDRFRFTLNLKTAKAIGLTIPQSVLLRADEVIE